MPPASDPWAEIAESAAAEDVDVKSRTRSRDRRTMGKIMRAAKVWLGVGQTDQERVDRMLREVRDLEAEQELRRMRRERR
jgi:hypothetical protein